VSDASSATAGGMRRRMLGLLQGRLVRGSALLFAGSLATGMLGYAYQVIMGRMLSSAEFGLFSALMAVFAIASAPLGAMMMVLSRKVSEQRALGNLPGIGALYRHSATRAAAIGLLLAAAATLLAPWGREQLKSPDVMPVILVAVLFFFTLPGIVNNAFLQGVQSFAWLSSGSALGVAFKILFSSLLVWLGFGVSGALAGAAAAAAAVWVVTFAALGSVVLRPAGSESRPRLSLRPAVPVLIANVAFVAMTQIDVVLVNHFFPPREAGIYAAAAVLGKAVMYLPGGIALALFPMVAEDHAREVNSAHLLAQAVKLAAALCLAGSAFYYLFGEWLVVLLFGEAYREAGEVLKYFGIAILPLGLVTIAEYFLIAQGRVLFAYLFFAVAPLQVLGIVWFHDALWMVVAVMGVCGALLAAIGYAMLVPGLRAREAKVP
jgi:O-antigen/teichoic acid export membrane protein